MVWVTENWKVWNGKDTSDVTAIKQIINKEDLSRKCQYRTKTKIS